MPIPVVSVNIMGGLGNQLFQIASAYAYAKRENGRLQIIKKTDNGNRQVYWDSFLKSVQPYLVHSLPPRIEQWRGEYESTKYVEIPPLPKNGIYLNGYLQSSKYFYNPQIKQEIKELFRQDPSILNQLKVKYQYLFENLSRVVVVHCRRTDYITAYECHGPLTGQYYTQAVEKLLSNVENPIFLLCGDDNRFWSEISDSISEVYKREYITLNNESDIDTLVLLQQFKHCIMSNSTFIWWAVWLGNFTNVIAPSKWFGPTGPKQWEDIYEPSWIRI